MIVKAKQMEVYFFHTHKNQSYADINNTFMLLLNMFFPEKVTHSYKISFDNADVILILKRYGKAACLFINLPF